MSVSERERRLIGTALRQVIVRRGRINLRARGYSMFPYIRPGDVCTFISVDQTRLKRGVIVLYQNRCGRLIAHRLLGCSADTSGKPHYLAKGDSNRLPDAPFSLNCLIGVMTAIRADRHPLRLTHLLRRTWCVLILNLPLLSRIVAKYLAVRCRLFGKGGTPPHDMENVER
ncbi:MAG: hypothetical protein LKI80_12670 [Sporolactobacillus sp.]|jgi:signal peptidase|nr:hypothetical protein [Sporolactobacillus sp.]